MGCLKSKKLNDTVVQDNGTIIKKCTSEETNFWLDLSNLNLVKVSKIGRKSVEFNYSDLYLENFISLAQITESLVLDQNFCFFLTVYEIIIVGLIFYKYYFI